MMEVTKQVFTRLKGPVTLDCAVTAFARRCKIFQSAARSQEKSDIFDDTETSRRLYGVFTAIMALLRSFYGVAMRSYGVSLAIFFVWTVLLLLSLRFLCAFTVLTQRYCGSHNELKSFFKYKF
jgi:hypothetical protein